MRVCGCLGTVAQPCNLSWRIRKMRLGYMSPGLKQNKTNDQRYMGILSIFVFVFFRWHLVI